MQAHTTFGLRRQLFQTFHLSAYSTTWENMSPYKTKLLARIKAAFNQFPANKIWKACYLENILWSINTYLYLSPSVCGRNTFNVINKLFVSTMFPRLNNSNITWWAASPEPNWKSMILSFPSCFTDSIRLFFKCFLNWKKTNFTIIKTSLQSTAWCHSLLRFYLNVK